MDSRELVDNSILVIRRVKNALNYFSENLEWMLDNEESDTMSEKESQELKELIALLEVIDEKVKNM